MGTILRPDKINKLVRSSATLITLPGTNLVTIMARQHLLSNKTFDATINGIGGLDIGSIAQNNYYYLYAVVSGSVVGLVASLSSTNPTGFLQYQKIGAFNTEQGASDIEQVLNFGEQPYSELYAHNHQGSAAVNTRFGRYATLLNLKGLEISWIPDTNDGDKFQCGKAGMYSATLGYGDTFASGQEYGLSINSDAFGNTNFSGMLGSNPELRFMGDRSSTATNVTESCSATRWLNDNDYLRVHSEQAASQTSGIEKYLTITKEGRDEIDWTI